MFLSPTVALQALTWEKHGCRNLTVRIVVKPVELEATIQTIVLLIGLPALNIRI